jgi:hypothetical protein
MTWTLVAVEATSEESTQSADGSCPRHAVPIVAGKLGRGFTDGTGADRATSARGAGGGARGTWSVGLVSPGSLPGRREAPRR